jgi:hypothetical protein
MMIDNLARWQFGSMTIADKCVSSHQGVVYASTAESSFQRQNSTWRHSIYSALSGRIANTILHFPFILRSCVTLISFQFILLKVPDQT